MSQAVLSLIILAVVVILYVTELLPIAVTTIMGCLALVWFQIVPLKVAFSGFSSDTVWLVIGMVMVGAALFETGVASIMGRKLIKLIGNSERSIMLGLYPVAMIMSAFLNNTSTTATFTPVIKAVSAGSDGKVRYKMLLMPLAFAATTGGMLTLVGSTPPLLVNGIMQDMGLKTFGFFEFGLIGLPICIIAMIYFLTVGKKIAENMWAEGIEEENLNRDFSGESDSEVVYDTRKMYRAGMILLFCIVGFTLQPTFKSYFTLGTVAITGAMLTVVLGCFSIKRLYELTDWNTFFVLGGAIGFASGLSKCGAGKLVADTAIALVGSASPFVIFSVFVLVGVVLTQMMSNTATTAMMAPIGIFVAQGMGFSPIPLMMGLASACAAAYMTPVGTPPNTIVLGPGNYRFMDYMKMGGLFQVISYLAIIFIVPMIWPL